MHPQPRPRRFDLEEPVWYRSGTDVSWRMGLSGSVSTTGAVVHGGDAAPPPRDEIVVVIGLPGAGCLVGRGRVIRVHPSEGLEFPTDFAVAVDGFTIQRRELILRGPRPVLHGC